MKRFLAGTRASSLAAAPAIWFVHFVAVYTLGSFACPAGAALQASPFVLSVTGIALLTLIGVGVSGYAATANLGKWRVSTAATGGESAAFLACTNVLVHVLAIVAMLWAAVPAFVLSPCPV